MTRIAMIAGPRNISTTMLRSFENREDMRVFDEPFYACYLQDSGARHPMREDILASLSTVWSDVVEQLNNVRSDETHHIFEKHIAFHFIEKAPVAWLRERKIFMLIRDPRLMVASYRHKYEDVDPIKDSLSFQVNLHKKYLADGQAIPIFDAKDIVLNPEPMLKALCDCLGISFDDAMLSWPAGSRPSDGVWGPHWYDMVNSSTGFRPYKEKIVELTPELEELASCCMPDYEYLYARRVKL